MSKVALSGSALGTGTFTIASPNSNTDRTLNLPDASGTVQVSGNPISGTTASFSGDVTLGSSVLATPTGSAPSYTCRAWVNFSGTGTVAIRASGNVSSITDRGTGQYTVNFSTAMPDANYATNASIRKSDSSEDGNMGICLGSTGTAYSTSGVAVTTRYYSNEGLKDGELICVSVFR